VSGLIGRILASIVAVAALVVGLMFSVFVFAAALVTGVLLFTWIWWRLHRVLKQAQQQAGFGTQSDTAGSAPPSRGGTIIEGEVIREAWTDRAKSDADSRRPADL
jgi:hypothetical protein